MSAANNGNSRSNRIDRVVTNFFAATLDKDDGEVLADEITDDLIRLLQSTFPGRDCWYWQVLLADFRAQMARRLAARLANLVEIDAALDLLDEASRLPRR